MLTLLLVTLWISLPWGIVWYRNFYKKPRPVNKKKLIVESLIALAVSTLVGVLFLILISLPRKES